MEAQKQPPTTQQPCEVIDMDLIMQEQPQTVPAQDPAAVSDQDPSPQIRQEDIEAKKRRRAQLEKEKSQKLRWDLQCRIADISADIELLTKEVYKIRSNLNHPLPPLSALPDFEQQTLASANAKRLKDIVSIHCKKALSSIVAHKWSRPFNIPVDTTIYKDYLDKVSTPMDLGTIRKRIDSFHYAHPDEFLADVQLVFNNAKAYNKPGSDVYVMANTLQEKFQDKYNSAVLPRIRDAELIADSAAEAARRRYATAAATAAGFGRQAIEQQTNRLLRKMDRVGARVADAKSAAAAMCTPLSRTEKESLCQSLKTMSNKHFEVAVALVLHHNPGLHPFDDVGFDLDQLDALTLRQLQSFVETVDMVVEKERIESGGGGGGGGEGVVWPRLVVGSGMSLGKRKRRNNNTNEGNEGNDGGGSKNGGGNSGKEEHGDGDDGAHVDGDDEK